MHRYVSNNWKLSLKSIQEGKLEGEIATIQHINGPSSLSFCLQKYAWKKLNEGNRICIDHQLHSENGPGTHSSLDINSAWKGHMQNYLKLLKTKQTNKQKEAHLIVQLSFLQISSCVKTVFWVELYSLPLPGVQLQSANRP